MTSTRKEARPATKRGRNQRSWWGGALASIIALSWAVGGVVMPSMAADGAPATVDGDGKISLPLVSEGENQAKWSGTFTATDSYLGQPVYIITGDRRLDYRFKSGSKTEIAIAKTDDTVFLPDATGECLVPAREVGSGKAEAADENDTEALGITTSPESLETINATGWEVIPQEVVNVVHQDLFAWCYDDRGVRNIAYWDDATSYWKAYENGPGVRINSGNDWGRIPVTDANNLVRYNGSKIVSALCIEPSRVSNSSTTYTTDGTYTPSYGASTITDTQVAQIQATVRRGEETFSQLFPNGYNSQKFWALQSVIYSIINGRTVIPDDSLVGDARGITEEKISQWVSEAKAQAAAWDNKTLQEQLAELKLVETSRQLLAGKMRYSFVLQGAKYFNATELSEIKIQVGSQSFTAKQAAEGFSVDVDCTTGLTLKVSGFLMVAGQLFAPDTSTSQGTYYDPILKKTVSRQAKISFDSLPLIVSAEQNLSCSEAKIISTQAGYWVNKVAKSGNTINGLGATDKVIAYDTVTYEGLQGGKEYYLKPVLKGYPVGGGTPEVIKQWQFYPFTADASGAGTFGLEGNSIKIFHEMDAAQVSKYSKLVFDEALYDSLSATKPLAPHLGTDENGQTLFIKNDLYRITLSKKLFSNYTPNAEEKAALEKQQVTFTLSCSDGKSYTATANALGGKALFGERDYLELAANTECSVSESLPADSAYIIGSSSFGRLTPGATDNFTESAEWKFKVDETSDQNYFVFNKYEKPAGLVIKKVVTPVAGVETQPFANKAWNFTVTCIDGTGQLIDLAAADAAFTLQDGQTKVISNIKSHSKCVVDETDRAATKGNYRNTVSWTLDGSPATWAVWTPDGTNLSLPGIVVPIEESATATVVATNEAVPQEVPGKLKVTKAVKDSKGKAIAIAGATYQVDVNCYDPDVDLQNLPKEAKWHGKATFQGAGTVEFDGLPAKDLKCVVTETQTLPASRYTFKAATFALGAKELDQSQPVFTASGKDQTLLVTNIFEEKTGAFRIQKNLNDPTGVFAKDENLFFEFDYQCFEAPGVVSVSETAKVYPYSGDNNKKTVLITGIPYGQECTVTEKAFGEHIIGTQKLRVTITDSASVVIPDGNTEDNSVTFRVGDPSQADCDPVDVFADNVVYQSRPSKLTLTKQTAGSAAQAVADKAFDFSVSCTNDKVLAGSKFAAQATFKPSVKAGESVTLGDGSDAARTYLAAGTTCTISENAGRAPEGTKLTALGWRVDGQNVTANEDGSVTVTLPAQSGSSLAVVATNTYDYRPASFQVVKTVNAPAGKTLPSSYNFRYNCGEGKKDLTGVKAGEPVTVSVKPGAKCQIWEVQPTGTADPALIWSHTLQASFADGHSTQAAATSEEVPLEFSVAAGNEPTVSIAAVNTYTLPGEFTITKTLAGLTKPTALDAGYNFGVSCTTPGGKILGTAELLPKGHTIYPNGNVGNLTVSHRELVEGTVCHVWEETRADRSVLSWNIDSEDFAGKNAAKVVIGKDGAAPAVVATNTYPSYAAFEIAKKLTDNSTLNGEKVTYLKAGTAFAFDVRCQDAAGKWHQVISGGKLRANTDDRLRSSDDSVKQIFPDGIPVGVQCQVVEKDTTENPVEIAGLQRSAPKYTGADKDGYFTVGAEQVNTTIQVAVENIYQRPTGHLQVDKSVKVEGDVDLSKLGIDAYEFTYNCTDQATSELVTKGQPITGTLKVTDLQSGGVSDESTEIPVGYHCTLSEKSLGEISGVKVISQIDNAGSLDITEQEANTVKTVKASNTFTSKTGRFVIKKQLAGQMPAGYTQPTKFRFQYTCGDITSKPIEVPVDGKWTSPELPVGTQCTVTELDGEEAGLLYQVDWVYNDQENSTEDSAEMKAITVNDAKSFETVTIGLQTRYLHVTNTPKVKKIPLLLVKTLQDNPQEITAQTSFYFSYECENPNNAKQKVSRKNIEVKASGQPVALTATPEDYIPYGYTCKVWEEKPATLAGAHQVVNFVASSVTSEANPEVLAVADSLAPGQALSFTATSPEAIYIGAENSYTTPAIKTDLQPDNPQLGVDDTEITLTDIVTYENVPAGKYRLVGYLMPQGAAIDATPVDIKTGSEVSLPGATQLSLSFQVTRQQVLANPQGFTAYEFLLRAEDFDGDQVREGAKPIAWHAPATKDLPASANWDEQAQADQSVVVTVEKLEPKVSTVAQTNQPVAQTNQPVAGGKVEKTLPANQGAVVFDTTTYENLPVGTYQVMGRLIDQQTKAVVVSAQAEKDIVVTSGRNHGSVLTRFEIPAAQVTGGRVFLAQEYLLQKGETDLSKASFKHDEDVAAQRVSVDQPPVFNPQLNTVATAGDDKVLSGAKDLTVSDAISWSGLPGGSYELRGELVFKQDTTLVDGTQVKAGTPVDAWATGQDMKVAFQAAALEVPADATPETTGTHAASFTIPQAVFENLPSGTELVVFEHLYQGSKHYFSHAELADGQQTVSVLQPQAPEVKIATSLSADGSRGFESPEGEIPTISTHQTQLIDQVKYENLPATFAGKDLTYRLKARLVMVSGSQVTETNNVGQRDFRPAAGGSGIETVTIPITDTRILNPGVKVVAYEELVRLEVKDGKTTEVLVADHKDSNSLRQTVNVEYKPWIGTRLQGPDQQQTLSAGEDWTLIDTVEYKGLTPNLSYVLRGELQAKDGDKPVGTGIRAEATFTPTTSDSPAGKGVEVKFTVKAADVKKLWKTYAQGGKLELVAFEYLYQDGKQPAGNEVGQPDAPHAVLSDGKQTVTFVEPSLKTAATVNGRHAIVVESGKGLEVKDYTITDTVTYTGLVKGRTYALQGTLMTPGADGKGVKFTYGKDAKTITAAKTFVAPSANGTVDLEFTLPAEAITQDLHLVVFERLWAEGAYTAVEGNTVQTTVKPTLSHEVINDEQQTITVSNPKFGDFSLTKRISQGVDPAVAANESLTFHFDVQCYNLKGVAVPEFKASPALKNGETWEGFSGIPDGYRCEVKENLDKLTHDTGLGSKVAWFDGAAGDGSEKALAGSGAQGQVLSFVIGGASHQFTYRVVADNKLSQNPALATSASTTDNRNVVPGQKIFDEVKYYRLSPGAYILHTRLAVKEGSKFSELTSAPSTATSVVVKAEQTTGSWLVEIPVPVDLPANTHLVVWEDLYEAGQFDLSTGKPKLAPAAAGEEAQPYRPVLFHHEEELDFAKSTQSARVKQSYGSFSIEKRLVLPAGYTTGNIPSEFTFSYSCVAPAGVEVPAGTALTGSGIKVSEGKHSPVFDGLPSGTVCTVKEDNAAVAGYSLETTWASQVLGGSEWSSGKSKTEQVITIGISQHITVQATNRYVKDVPPTTPVTTPPPTTPVTPPTTPVIPPFTPPVSPNVTTPVTPNTPATTPVPSTPPVLPATEVPVAPPVLPATTLPPAAPKLPPALAHTGVQAAVLGGMAVLLLALGAGIGMLARSRRK